MKIHFVIEYITNWGEELRLQLSQMSADGKGTPVKECQMETFDGRIWECEIALSTANTIGIEYKYAMYRNGRLVWTEWDVAPHKVSINSNYDNYTINDYWRPIPEDLPLFSSAYTECIGKHDDKQEAKKLFREVLQLRVVEPRLRQGEHLAVCGNVPQLGGWNIPQRMSCVELQEWRIDIDASILYNQLEYKYVIVDDKNNILHWEEGPNRKIRSTKLTDRQMWIKTDRQPVFDLPRWKAAGIVIPVFSLRSKKSYGIGDFGDLKMIIGWASSVKMHVIQILPINDTTMTGKWTDSYPYNAISTYALHPIYCNLNALPRLTDKVKMEKFMMKQEKLNNLAQIDYEKAFALKMEYLRLIFKQEGKAVLKSEAFKQYYADNEDWLIPYSAFCYLRDTFGTAEFDKWPKHSKYNKKDICKLCAPTSEAYDECALHMYIQYILHVQLTEVRNEARARGIIIKGDIPIGISRNSVEAWADPHLFNLDSQAGAPPDDFSVNGQNWGFPTYNWDEMAKDGYGWWLRRFKKMSEYFDAYRIDHVLGFFRIWEIPMHSVHGLLGHFSPALPMSATEIEGYGIKFRQDLMTRPFITDESLSDIFGYRKELVTMVYLDSRPDGRYDLKEEYNTQRKIEAAFKDKTDEESITIRDGLYSLASCVLFVPDNRYQGLYHPRISAQNDYMYKALPKHEQEAFDKLYNNYFFKRHNDFWYNEAMEKLPALTQSTRMLTCAEDLGMVPDCVPWVMNNLRILSLEIQTMPKAMGLEFGLLHDNPYRSVATISTHDMSPLRLWWKEDRERAQRFYNNALQKDGPAPKDAPGWLCEDIVVRHLFSPSALCLLSYQDWIAMDDSLRHDKPEEERINIPANPRHYWRYRMRLNIEQLQEAKDFNNKVRALIENSGRG